MGASTEAEKRMAIAAKVADAYCKLPEVGSIAVGGSTARGNADEYSDIDIWMTWDPMPEETMRRAVMDILDESGRAVPAHSLESGLMHAESLVVGGVHVGVHPGSNEVLLTVGIDMGGQLGTPAERGIADMHDCIVLYDPSGLYSTVKARLSDYPVSHGTRVMQECIDRVCSICTVRIPRAVRGECWVDMLQCRSEALEALLRIVFVLNRDYFPRVKDAEWLLGSMAHLPKGFVVRVRDLARASSHILQRRLIVDMALELVVLARTVWPEPIHQQTVDALHSAATDLL